MARIIVLVLLASLALAPVAEAAATGRAESPVTAWLDALRSVFDRLFSWGPSIREAPRKNGANIIPNGFVGPPPPRDPGCMRSVTRKNGAMIVPNGFAGPPPCSDRSVRSLAGRSGAVIIPNGIGSPPLPNRWRVAVPEGAHNRGR